MLIRPETEADYAAVAEVTAAAVPLSPYDASLRGRVTFAPRRSANGCPCAR